MTLTDLARTVRRSWTRLRGHAWMESATKEQVPLSIPDGIWLTTVCFKIDRPGVVRLIDKDGWTEEQFVSGNSISVSRISRGHAGEPPATEVQVWIEGRSS